MGFSGSNTPRCRCARADAHRPSPPRAGGRIITGGDPRGEGAMRTVVMTGAAGGVARHLRPLLAGVFERLILSDRHAPADLRADETYRAADLGDPVALHALLADVDGIIHLGGCAREDSWDAVRAANIDGLYNLYEAARRQGVGRIVFASSNHAFGFYRRDRRIDAEVRPRPDSRYGVSKVFGEALGALYARKYGVRSFNIRIGNVAEHPADRRRLAIWLHPEDLVQLIRIGLDHPDVVDDVVYGASDCERSWWNNRRARELGYRPAHKAEDHLDQALQRQAKLPPDPIGDQFQGGPFCSDEFDGGLADRD
jgi:uronate dehydrogenase